MTCTGYFAKCLTTPCISLFEGLVMLTCKAEQQFCPDALPFNYFIMSKDRKRKGGRESQTDRLTERESRILYLEFIEER